MPYIPATLRSRCVEPHRSAERNEPTINAQVGLLVASSVKRRFRAIACWDRRVVCCPFVYFPCYVHLSQHTTQRCCFPIIPSGTPASILAAETCLCRIPRFSLFCFNFPPLNSTFSYLDSVTATGGVDSAFRAEMGLGRANRFALSLRNRSLIMKSPMQFEHRATNLRSVITSDSFFKCWRYVLVSPQSKPVATFRGNMHFLLGRRRSSEFAP